MIDNVFREAEAFALDRAQGQRQRQVLARAFCGLWRKASCGSICIDFPLLVLRSLGGDLKNAQALGVATTLFYCGLDIFDDVADGDLPADLWQGVRPAEADLAAVTLFFSLATLALDRIAISDTRKTRMRMRLAEGFLNMAAGQHVDIELQGASDFSPDAVEASVTAKTGKEFSLFAQLAAIAANTSEEKFELCGRLGEAFGTASQLASDCFELFNTSWSRDLASGTRTLPLALHLDSLETGRDRAAFVNLLERARHKRRDQKHVIRLLLDGGALRKMSFIIESYSQDALDALASLGTDAGDLECQIRRVSLISYI
jgi:geranylgeranyl pyrophosphate synthase